MKSQWFLRYIWVIFTFCYQLEQKSLYEILQKQLEPCMPEAGMKESNYTPEYMWDIIICPGPWYLLVVSRNCLNGIHLSDDR